MESQVLLRSFWIVLAIVVVGVFFYKIQTLKSGEEFKFETYAEDLSLTISRMLNTKGNLEIEYNLPSDYEVRLEGNVVVVKFGRAEIRKEFFGNNKKITINKEKEKIILRKNE